MLGEGKFKNKIIDFHCNKIMHDWLNKFLDFSVVKERAYGNSYLQVRLFCKAISSKISIVLVIF